MEIVFDYEKIEKLTSIDLVSELKEDVSHFMSKDWKIEKVKVDENGNYVTVGMCTMGGFLLYTHSKITGGFTRKMINYADYWFIQDMWEGENA